MELNEEDSDSSNHGQNLVEVEEEKEKKVVMNSTDLIELNFSIKNLNTNNFGTVNSNL